MADARGPGRAPSRAHGRPGPWRKAPAGIGGSVGALTAAVAAGRAHGRDGPRGIGPHDPAAAGHEGRLRHPAGGTRHGRRLCAGRSHQRAGLRQGGVQRCPRRGAAPSGRARRLPGRRTC
nr:hypothetical protein [Achromobacter deleyi]